jgi:hypothetical protein
MDKVRGVVETPVALAANLVSGPITYLAGAGGPAFQKSVAKEIQYQPRTQLAQQALEAVGQGLEASKLPPFMPMIGGPMNALAPASRAIGDIARSENALVKGAVAAPLEARQARIQASRVAESQQNAPIIEASQAAQRIGAAINPAVSNPTKGNIITGKLASGVDERLAKNNEVAVTNKVREDLGLTPDQPLNKQAVESALDVASKPYDVVRQIPVLQPDTSTIQALAALRKPASAVAKGRVEATNALVNNVIDEVSKGRSGADVLTDIRQLRAEANSVYKRRDKGLNVPTAAEIAEADARSSVAKIYEQMIDNNVNDPQVLADLQAARTKMAQIYDHERALDYGQQKVDPQAYAKMYEERKGNMTGVGADIAKVASTFPSVMTLTPAAEKGLPRITRGSVSGALGATIGGLLGNVPGAAIGAAAGVGAGEVASALAARRISTPAYQAANAIPKDYRPAVNMLRPVEPNATPNGLVPYNYAQSVVMPGEQPNFVFGRPEAQVTAGMPQGGPAQLGAPSGEATMAAIAAERARAAAMSRTLGQQAEQQQAAQAAAGRQPTGAGSVLEFNPITGTYKVGGAGVKGATPEIFQADTGASLKSATDKVAAGKLFDLNAAEKVAWEKTKVDLAAVDPGLTKLSDKAVAAKMMDRQWIADTSQKVKDKAIANEAIAARATTERARQTALMEREKLMGQLADLEDRFSKARPVQKGGQGPKTRAFQRNMLTPEQEIQNALVSK